MKNKFTLIELISVIVVIAILASIVLVNVSSFKKKAITSSMQANIKIIQTATDSYFLEKNSLPISNKNQLSLENPQLINITELKESGYLKKDLDKSKIKTQYYWVDVFGTVWGATQKPTSGINLIEKSNSKYALEFEMGEHIDSFNTYETYGYDTHNLTADLKKDVNKFYKMIGSVNKKSSKKEFVSVELENKNAAYLISLVDEYGLELAPMGKFNNSSIFEPVYNKEGTYKFEIANDETMYWVDFLTLEEKNGGTINYLFQVENEKGTLSEPVEDFFSLEPSKRIVVTIELKGNGSGKNPILYDIRVLFKFKDEEILKPEVSKCQGVECYSTNVSCPSPSHVNNSGNWVAGGSIQIPVQYYIGEFKPQSISDIIVLKPSIPVRHEITNITYYVFENGVYSELSDTSKTHLSKCGYALYDIKLLEDKIIPDKTPICGNGTIKPTISGSNLRFVYKYFIKEDENISSIEIKNDHSQNKIKKITMYLSHKGEPYQMINSISEIKSDSCLQIVYDMEEQKDKPTEPKEPEVKTCSNCKPPTICGENCVGLGDKCLINCEVTGNPPCIVDNCNPPVDKDCHKGCFEEPPCLDDCSPVQQEEEWETVETLRFFANGPTNRTIRWYGFEKEVRDEEEGVKRVVFNFSKSNGSNWSPLYEEFSETGDASSVVAIAFIQVKKEFLSSVDEAYHPKVDKVVFKSELGDLPISMTTPTLSIIAKKDNNFNRSVFSNASNIEWDVAVADPRNLKITGIEWGGDIRSNYPVGMYEVKARATNERGYTSEWQVFKFEVLEEKPVAIITILTDNSNGINTEKSKFNISLNESYDPDGDRIVDYQWENKKTSYPNGKHTVKLRVKDEEGHWSDWASREIVVSDEAYNVYRIEAEDVNSPYVKHDSLTLIRTNAKYSAGNGAIPYSHVSYVTFNFEGSGFEVFTDSYEPMHIIINNGPIQKLPAGLNTFKGLEFKTHEVKIASGGNSSSHEGVIDYLDVLSPKDEVLISNIHSKVLGVSGESAGQSNEFSTELNQKLNVYYKTSKNSNETIFVVDDKGNLVKSLKNNDPQKGEVNVNKLVVWDGKNNTGNFVQNGTYTVKIEQKGANGTITNADYKVVMKNLIPTIRLEAESNSVKKEGVTTLASNAKYSGGEAITSVGPSSIIIFTFEGTGFDISTSSYEPMKMTIDGRSYNINSGVNSFKNLSSGTHEIQINATKASSSYYGHVDYIDVYNPDDTVAINNVYGKVVNTNGEFNAIQKVFSTRLSQTINVYYLTHKNSTESVSVVDSKGSVVREIKSSVKQKGDSSVFKVINWNGKDSNGVNAPDGIYKVLIEQEGVYGTKSKFEYQISIDNTPPSYRIEAESTDKNKVTLIGLNHTLSDNSYSGKNGVAPYSNKSFVEFMFAGTGFDIQVYNGPAKVTVEGKDYIVNSGKTSIRGLSNAKHSVQVTRINSSTSDSGKPTIDYIDVYQ